MPLSRLTASAISSKGSLSSMIASTSVNVSDMVTESRVEYVAVIE